MAHRYFGRFALALALLLGGGTAAHASTLRASAAPQPAAPPVVGTVTDSAGRPLPNAQIAVGRLHRTTSTDTHGGFVLRALPPGTYALDVTLLGYAPAHATVVVPETGAEVTVRVVLRSTTLALQTLVVTGTPNATDPLRVTQSTTQVSGKELDRNLGATVAQTLAREPGIDTRYNGPAASTPVIRGLSGDRVLVLQNGQRTGDLSGAAQDHGLSIDPLAASRLEVVRGPASLLYGSGAIGGVVNVITTDIPTAVPTHVDGYAALQGESVNPGGAGTVEATVPLGASLALTARGGLRRVDDVRVGGGGTLSNTYLHNEHGDVGLGYVGEKASGGVAFNEYRFDYGLPAPAGDPEAGVHISGRRHEGTGRLEIPLGASWLSDVRVDGTAQWYSHDEIERTGDVGTSFGLKTQTAGVQGRTRFGGLDGAIGVSGLFRQYQSTGEEALTPAANSTNVGVFAFEEVPLGRDAATAPRLQLGARYDGYRIASRTGDEKFGPGRRIGLSAFSGSAGVSIPFSRGTSLGVSVARAFRAPTVEELFSNAFHAAVGSFDRGNPDLKPETNLGVEAVLRAQTGRVSAQASTYWNRIDNYIGPNIVGTVSVEGEAGDSVEVPLNVFSQGDATLRGVEGKAELAVTRRVVVGAMGDYVRGTFRAGGNLPFMPPARLGGLARWDDGRFSAETSFRHAFAQDRVSQGEQTTQGYDLLDVSLGLSRVLGGHVQTVTLRGDNLLDERYFDATSRIKEFAPNPGRNVSLVYKVLF